MSVTIHIKRMLGLKLTKDVKHHDDDYEPYAGVYHLCRIRRVIGPHRERCMLLTLTILTFFGWSLNPGISSVVYSLRPRAWARWIAAAQKIAETVIKRGSVKCNYKA